MVSTDHFFVLLCCLTSPSILFLLRPVVPHGFVPLQLLAEHAGLYLWNPEECALPATAKDCDSFILRFLV